MRITSLEIIFVLITFCFVVIIDIKTSTVSSLAQKRIEYNKILDSATEDAVCDLVEINTNREFILNKEKAYENFMRTLYIQFGIVDDSYKQEKLKLYLPLIAVIDVDGFYILSNEEYTMESDTVLYKIWKEKLLYIVSDNYYIYQFTLKDNIKVIDKSSNEVYEGSEEDIKEKLNSNSLLHKDNYQNIKQEKISNILRKEFGYFINSHNIIADSYDINYEFSLPELDTQTWARTIKDISFIAFFQGYPYGLGTKERYNRVCVSASRISRYNPYYISAVDDILYYHRKNCYHISNLDEPLYSKKLCALKGAYPCFECIP